ncbi:MAG: hypothetical protein LBT92_03065 [Rickettsiales bacterium]|jgi:hypothetical protein|nr:hypothetical protein [Rickettsiales bacterium]
MKINLKPVLAAAAIALAACSATKCNVDGVMIPEGNPLVVPPDLRPGK